MLLLVTSFGLLCAKSAFPRSSNRYTCHPEGKCVERKGAQGLLGIFFTKQIICSLAWRGKSIASLSWIRRTIASLETSS